MNLWIAAIWILAMVLSVGSAAYYRVAYRRWRAAAELWERNAKYICCAQRADIVSGRYGVKGWQG